MARILLIQTRIENKDYPYGSPPLGLMYLASHLRKGRDHIIHIIDMRPTLMSPQKAAELSRDFRPDIIGISSLSLEESILHQTASAIKKTGLTCPIIAGGPHVNADQENVLKDENIDFLVLGEGEYTFPELTESILNGFPSFDTIQGIIFRQHEKTIKTPNRSFIENLDEILFPSWDLIDLPTYYNLPRFMRFSPVSGVPFMQIVSSRGCPFNCIYCHTIMGKRFRARSAKNVFDEIQTLYNKYGIKEFEFIDDCFNLDKQRVIDLCQLIIQSPLRIKMCFPNGLRGDLLDKEVLTLLKKAGTTEISFAPETGSLRIQKLIKKNANLDKLQQAILDAVKLKIHAHGFFMLGFPTETQEDLNLTLNFIKKTQLHTADFFIVNAFPHTQLYDMILAQGKAIPQDYSSIDFHNAPFNISDVSNKMLLDYQRKFFFTFYLNPLRILRLFTSPAIKKRYIPYYFWLFFNRAVLRKR
jgi:radical SAM superfamily enzyme YgiQ (UPF0313 family)